jgi:glycyl-tRNA synthetase
VRRQEEYEHSKYYFEIGNVERLRQMYDLYKAEAEACIAAGLVLPAYDYVLKCSHTFNALDCRGAIGVTERQVFYGQMRTMARQVAGRYLEQRKELEYPLLKEGIQGLGNQGLGDKEIRENPNYLIPNHPSTFLLEIGVEELPASDLDAAIVQLKINVPRFLQDLHLDHGAVRVSGTPRRLAVYVEALAPRQPDREDLLKGPPAGRAFGSDGVPTPAAIGFARGKGLTPKDLQVREFDGGKYVVALVKQAGRPAVEVLAGSLPALVAGLKFDKSMRWLPASRAAGNESGVTFSRPLRWFVALLGETVIPFEYAGLTAGRITRGLRPYNSPEILIPAADEYFNIIKKNGILLEVEERKALIAKGVKKLAASVGGEAILPDELLAEVANLVEKPMSLLGSFKEEFLTLPEDVLISVMKKHQRYFPIRAAGADDHPPLLPHFVIVRNGDKQGLDLVRQGNEHVVGARFADANFFVREDLKHKLEDFRPRLATLIFQKNLGSMLDKSDRMVKLAEMLAPMLGLTETERLDAVRGTFLSKADLVTRMVVEMTSLQGIMGREYALRSGENQAVATAIGEQYQTVPHSKPGLVVALADRLDALVGLFAAGLAPSGTKDPFGLRRAAIGIVQPLMEHGIDFDWHAAVRESAKLQPIEVNLAVQKLVLDFITGRLGVVLKDSGYKYDVVDAVLSQQSDRPSAAFQAVKQLSAWIARPDWGVILPGYARCVRITRDRKERYTVKPEAFVEEAERKLYEAVNAQASAFGGDVDALLNSIVALIPSINTFFDKVLVMAEEQSIRENRLGLLQRIAALADGVADLGKLEGF